MAHEAPRREQPQSRARAATADDDNVLRHKQPVPSTPRTCQLTRRRGPSPREHPRVGDTCCKHAPAPAERPPPRSNGVVCWGFFFYGFANYSVFLCGLPPERVPGVGPSPGSSSKRDSSWQAAVREGEDRPGWEANATAFPCAPVCSGSSSCFSL